MYRLASGRGLIAVAQEEALSREVEAMAEKLAAPAWRPQPQRPQPTAARPLPNAAQERVCPAPSIIHQIKLCGHGLINMPAITSSL